ncbi:MAG: M20/M25/M40 family metallo-hydrolase [Planctomycetes bacterium]|nr:M20/M25/M40 family metallo-hydrolase [Planctomycetota bacterium]
MHKLSIQTAACFALALALVAGCAVPANPAIARRIAEIDGAALRRHVEALAAIGPRPPADVEAARAVRGYLREELESYGYRVDEEHFHAPANVVISLPRLAGGGYLVYPLDAVPQCNLTARLDGKENPDRVVEVGAHFDTVYFTPGADDNSSGVAGVLEIARVLAGAECAKTVRFCLFAAEEGRKAPLAGSREHVRRIGEERAEQVEGIIVLEMIGFASSREGSQSSPAPIPFLSPPSTGDFIAVVGKLSSGWLGNAFENAARRYVPELPLYSANRIGAFFPDAWRSDHASYWSAGLAGVMITDTADFRNRNYHQPSDTPETLDDQFLERVTRATAAALLEWAEFRGEARAQPNAERRRAAPSTGRGVAQRRRRTGTAISVLTIAKSATMRFTR